MSSPLFFFTANRFPPQSGKYTASPSTVGVAETSPPVVNTHFGLKPVTLAGLMECSVGWFQLVPRFCPAIRHWPDRDSSDWLCALTAMTNESTAINAAVGSDASRFFMGIRIRLLELGFGITLAPLLSKRRRGGLSSSGIRSPLTPGSSAARLPKRGGCLGLRKLLIRTAMASRKTVP